MKRPHISRRRGSIVRALLALLLLLLVEPFILLEVASATDASPPFPSIAGVWSGEWRAQNSSAYGSMEFEIEVRDDKVAGRAKAGIRGDCSNSWEPIAGALRDGKILASYNLGGRCGKVNLILSLEPDGTMSGTWKSEYPSNGTYNLRKKPTAGSQ